ncbi:MAG: hypothetical protein WB812_15290, partial [Woeseiaceae bacterium]
AYRRAILALDPGAAVNELACELLVSLAEEGWDRGAIGEAILRRYLEELDADARAPDSVILGCTHFPLLSEIFVSVFDPEVSIVDSATTTAAAARDLLEELSLRNPGSGAGRLTLLATDGAQRFARVGGRFLGAALSADDIGLVDL